MRVFLLIACLSTSLSAFSQDLTGIWRGHFKSGSPGIEDRYKFETQINQLNRSLEGVTYSYQTTVFYGKAACSGAVNPETKKVILEETTLIEVKSASGGACLMTFFLQYSKVGGEEFLEGKYISSSSTQTGQCGSGGTVFLRKVPTSDFYTEPFLSQKAQEKKKLPVPRGNASIDKKKPAQPESAQLVPPQRPPAVKQPAPAKPVPAAPPEEEPIAGIGLNSDSLGKLMEKDVPEIALPEALASRKNELVRTITTPAKEVYIKIYDNGTIDNDTVSVYVDKKLVLHRQRLTDKPLTLKIDLDEHPGTHELIMVAENLGEIPPNTSLMVVTAGDTQYEVRITSTEQKNAVVQFKYSGKKAK